MSSPKSTTLAYNVQPVWKLIAMYPLIAFRYILPFILPVVLIVELLLLMYYVYSKKHKKLESGVRKQTPAIS